MKVNAYLRQRLGFNNTARLKDGIIGYERWLEEQEESSGSVMDSFPFSHNDENSAAYNDNNPGLRMNSNKVDSTVSVPEKRKSLFVGKNFVFDRRRLADNE